jgi:hypothetical protein
MHNNMPEAKEVLDKELADLIPFLEVDNDSNLCSSIHIMGSFDKRETWSNGIFQNSRYFQFSIFPKNKERDYKGGEMTLEVLTCASDKMKKKFRKVSGDKDKIASKLKEWILANI